MKTYAVVNEATNVVENTILWDGASAWSPPEGMFLIDISGQEIGGNFTYDSTTKTFAAPVYEAAQPVEQPSSTGTQTL